MSVPTPLTEPKKSLFQKPTVVGLLVVALLTEISYAVVNLSAMGPYLKEERELGAKMFSIVLSAFLFSEAISKTPMGHLADKYGRRFFIVLGPAMSIGTALLTIALPHKVFYEVPVLILLRVIDGLSLGMIWPAAFATISEAVDDDERQQAMSYLNMCYIVGIALALPIGGFVNDLTGHKQASFFLAAFLFACVSIAAFFLVPKHNTQVAAVPASGHEGFSASDFLVTVKQIPVFMFLAVVTFMGVGAPMPVMKTFPIEQFNLSESAIGALVFPAAIAMALLSVPMTKFGERIGLTRSVHYGLAMCAIGMGTIASGMVLPFMRSPIVLALGGIPCGLGFLLAIPAWYASVSNLNPDQRGVFIGTVMTGQGLGAIIGALVGGFSEEAMRPVGRALGLGVEFGRYMPFGVSALFIFSGWALSMKILKHDVVGSSDVVSEVPEVVEVPPVEHV